MGSWAFTIQLSPQCDVFSKAFDGGKGRCSRYSAWGWGGASQGVGVCVGGGRGGGAIGGDTQMIFFGVLGKTCYFFWVYAI